MTATRITKPKRGDRIIHNDKTVDHVFYGTVVDVLSQQFTYRVTAQDGVKYIGAHEGRSRWIRYCMFNEDWGPR